MTNPSRVVSRLARLPQRRRAIVAVAMGTVGALVAGAVVVAGSGGSSEPPPCALDRPLQVIADPHIAPVIAAVLKVAPASAADTTCPVPRVRAEDPASTVAAMATDAADRPDIWIPDSSVWTTRTLSEGAGLPGDNPSVASSPFVLAVPASETAGPLRVGDLIAPQSAISVRWVLPDPTRSAPTLAAVLAMRTALEGRTDAAAVLEETVRGADQARIELAALPQQGGPTLAVPTTEQQVFAQGQADPSARLLPAYGSASLTADFPFIVLAAERARRLEAATLLDVLHGDLGRRLLASHGFRDPAGAPGALLASQPGVDRAFIPVRVPPAQAVAEAVAGLRAIRASTRVLAVVDVSGSMGRAVPGTGGATRLALALQGMVAGLATYPDDTVAGLWTFATRMTPTTDHRELVPLVALGRGPDGTLGRARLAEGLTRVELRPNRRTALYDTVLAAVREVRRDWDPDRVNSVVLLTDGADSDRDGISLRGLLRRLLDEQQTGRPVAVFAVGYGPSADNAALEAIAGATGGVAYQTQDPRAVGSMIADAIGRRACADQCS